MRFTRGFTLALTLALASPALAQSPAPTESAASGAPAAAPSPDAGAAPRRTGTGDGGPPAAAADAGSNGQPATSTGTGAGGPPSGSAGGASGGSGGGTGAGGPPQAPPPEGIAGGGTGPSGTGAGDPYEDLGGGGGGGGPGSDFGFPGGFGRGPFGGRGGPGGLHGLARLIRPERSQWLGMARFAIHMHRAGATHMANLAALRLEIVEQLIAQQPDDKVLDGRVDALAAELQKTSDAIVDLLFEGRELLSPEQRKALTERLALCLIGAPGGPDQLAGRGKPGTPPAPSSGGGWAGRGPWGRGGDGGGKSWWPFGRKDGGPGAAGHGPFGGGRRGPPAPPPPPPPPPFHLDFEQQAQLKRMLIHASPAFARAAGEAVAQGLTVADELLNENPAKDKVKAAMDAIVAQAVVMLRAGLALAREARGVLTARQIEEALAHAPVPLLLGGMAGMWHHGPPPPPPPGR